MARTQTMVQLYEELVETLDRVASRRGSARSALIRDLLLEAFTLDNVTPIRASLCTERITTLAADRMREVCGALAAAGACTP